MISDKSKSKNRQCWIGFKRKREEN